MSTATLPPNSIFSGQVPTDNSLRVLVVFIHRWGTLGNDTSLNSHLSNGYENTIVGTGLWTVRGRTQFAPTGFPVSVVGDGVPDVPRANTGRIPYPPADGHRTTSTACHSERSREIRIPFPRPFPLHSGKFLNSQLFVRPIQRAAIGRPYMFFRPVVGGRIPYPPAQTNVAFSHWLSVNSCRILPDRRGRRSLQSRPHISP